MNLTLIDAFSRFGAIPSSRFRALSAMAADGAMVLNCSQQHFGHPSRGVLRYEDKLSRVPDESKDIRLLGEHLGLARDGALPVRMVVGFPADVNPGGVARGYHVRFDLIGKVVTFDGDHFVVDFTRPEAIEQASPSKRRK